MDFVKALKENDIHTIQKCPKADLHNHFVLGGERNYIKQNTGYTIKPISTPLSSMNEMNSWSNRFISTYFDNPKMRKLLIEAAFVQARQDGVKILEIGEDVWALKEFYHNDVIELIEAFQEANQRVAPEIELRLQIGLSRHCPVDYLLECLKHFWGHCAFYSIDLYGDEFSQPIEHFVPIYERAKEMGASINRFCLQFRERYGLFSRE